MNALPKYALTHGTERTGWANSHAITADDVPRLKGEATRPIALFAGAATTQALLARGCGRDPPDSVSRADRRRHAPLRPRRHAAAPDADR
jgi:hypothetical protein